MFNQTRRQFITLSASALAGVAALRAMPAFAATPSVKLVVPPLSYAPDALAPLMSAETLLYHHGKHHQAYADKGNELIAKAGVRDKSIEDIILWAHDKPEQAALFNNVAQFWNHVQFWNWIKPNGGGTKLPQALQTAVDKSFGSYDAFRTQFIDAGMTQFGSGWAWLAADKTGALRIMKTANGDNPLIVGLTPVLGVDVWEHAYYLDHRNARQKYLEGLVDKLINWDYVADLYGKIV